MMVGMIDFDLHQVLRCSAKVLVDSRRRRIRSGVSKPAVLPPPRSDVRLMAALWILEGTVRILQESTQNLHTSADLTAGRMCYFLSCRCHHADCQSEPSQMVPCLPRRHMSGLPLVITRHSSARRQFGSLQSSCCGQQLRNQSMLTVSLKSFATS